MPEFFKEKVYYLKVYICSIRLMVHALFTFIFVNKFVYLKLNETEKSENCRELEFQIYYYYMIILS